MTHANTIRPISFSHSITVAILYYHGTKDDDEDTISCAKGIAEALQKLGHSVKKIAVNKKNWKQAVETPADVVFNLVEDDLWDLYRKVGLRLEKLGRAQVGHDTKNFLYTLQKTWVKQKMKKMHIATPLFKIFNHRSTITQVRALEYPIIVKPSQQHAGNGISQDSVVIDQTELEERVNYLFAHYPGDVIAEEYINGREIHVTLLGNGKQVMVLPFCEIGFGGDFKDNWDVYTYESKWDQKSWEYWDARVTAPAIMSKALHEKIRKLTHKAYQAFGCRDVARMDVRINEKDQPFIVDVNINPSLNYYDEQDATLASVYALGWTYNQFIETVAAISYKRVYKKLA